MSTCLDPLQLQRQAINGQPTVNAFVKLFTKTEVQPPKGSEFAMNFIFHVFILFFALTMLFKFIIAPLESRTITEELGSKATESVNEMFETLRTKRWNARKEAVERAVQAFNSKIAALSEPQLTAHVNVIQRAVDAFQMMEKNIEAHSSNDVMMTNMNTLSISLRDLQIVDGDFVTISNNIRDANQNASVVIQQDTISFLQRLSLKYATPDVATQEHNRNVMTTAYFILAILGVVLIVLVATLAGGGLNMKRPILHVLFENLIVFGVVGAAEFLFFMQVASKFIPVMPSQLSRDVIGTLKDKFPASAPA